MRELKRDEIVNKTDRPDRLLSGLSIHDFCLIGQIIQSFLKAVGVRAFSLGQRLESIADFIKTNQIHGVCILHGDSHMLAADDGTNSDYATGGERPSVANAVDLIEDRRVRIAGPQEVRVQ
jgi:hypothetical protein